MTTMSQPSTPTTQSITCVVCRATGIDAFAPSETGFYVCLRCGTQSQRDAVEDVSELGFERTGEALVPGMTPSAGGGGARRMGLRARRGGGTTRREEAAAVARALRERRAPNVRKRRAMRDERRGIEAYVGCFQELLMAQLDAIVGERGVDAVVVNADGVEATTRTIWERYLVASGATTGFVDEENDKGEDDVTIGVGVGEKKNQKNGGDDRGSLLTRMTSRLPMYATLGMVYVACARHREAILPCDLSRMAMEGTIPYLNANAIFKNRFGAEITRELPSENAFQITMVRAPTPERIVATAAYVAAKIGVQLPPVNASGLLTRFVRELNLHAGVQAAAHRTLSLYLSPALWYGAPECVGTPESAVMATLVVALKMLYGLDGRTHTVKGRRRRRCGEGNAVKISTLDVPSTGAVPSTGWDRWAEATEALGAPLLPLSEERVASLDDADRNAYVRFCFHDVFGAHNVGFPFDRIEEKLLKLVPATTLNGEKFGRGATRRRRATLKPPEPSLYDTDPYVKFLKSKRSLLAKYERRVEVAVAYAVVSLRERERGFGRNASVLDQSALEREAFARAGGVALRPVTGPTAGALVKRMVIKLMYTPDDELMEVMGGVEGRRKARLEHLVRDLVSQAQRRAEFFDSMKYVTRDFVTQEDENLISQYSSDAGALLRDIQRVLEDLTSEQEELDDVVKFTPEWNGYDCSSAQVADALRNIPVPRTAGEYLLANRFPFDSCPDEYIKVVRALARLVWVSPESLHASVQELEFVLTRVEKEIRKEVDTKR